MEALKTQLSRIKHAVSLEEARELLKQSFMDHPLTSSTTVTASISSHFKFLSGVIKAHPSLIPEITNWVMEAKASADSFLAAELKRSCISLLGRIRKGRIRKQFFQSHLFQIWDFIFHDDLLADGENWIKNDTLSNATTNASTIKLMLVKEYRRELPFHWLLLYVSHPQFFYLEDLQALNESSATQSSAILSILLHFFELAKSGRPEWREQLCSSGILEKSTSLWTLLIREDSLLARQCGLLKMLTFTAFLSRPNFYLKTQTLALLTALQSHLIFTDDRGLWSLRLTELVTREFPRKMHILSRRRGEFAELTLPILFIVTKSLRGMVVHYPQNQLLIVEAFGSLLHAVLGRIDHLEVDSWNELISLTSEYLDLAYFDPEPSSGHCQILKAFVNFPTIFRNDSAFRELLVKFFRNSLKLFRQQETSGLLTEFTKLFIEDASASWSLAKLFQLHPGLIDDIYFLISSGKVDWLEVLIESGSEKIPSLSDLLLEVVLDPLQINSLSGDLWLRIVGKLIWICQGDYERIDQWLRERDGSNHFKTEDLVQGLLSRRHAEKSHFLALLRQVLGSTRLSKALKEDSDILADLFVLAAGDLEICQFLIGYVPSLGLFHKIIPRMIEETSPEVAKFICERTPFNPMKASSKKQLLSELFGENNAAEGRYLAASLIKLLLKAGILNYRPKYPQIRLVPEFYRETDALFHALTQKSLPAIQDTQEDYIDTLLMYWKYGDVRSVHEIEASGFLVGREMGTLLRIPVGLLLADEFGRGVLNWFGEGGWNESDVAELVQFTLQAKENHENLKTVCEFYCDAFVEDVI